MDSAIPPSCPVRAEARTAGMLVVFNPTAGRRSRRRLTRALDALTALGVRAELAETEWPGHAEAIARAAAERGVPIVVAAGGDGTIAEVAGGIAGAPGTTLGLLPLGTANVLACELGIPAAPEAAGVVLAAGRAASLRPGLARFADGQRRLFVQMLGAGFDAAVVASLDLGLKRRIGRAAYVWQTMRELPRYRFPPLSVAFDGAIGSQRVASVIVSKGRL